MLLSRKRLVIFPCLIYYRLYRACYKETLSNNFVALGQENDFIELTQAPLLVYLHSNIIIGRSRTSACQIKSCWCFGGKPVKFEVIYLIAAFVRPMGVQILDARCICRVLGIFCSSNSDPMSQTLNLLQHFPSLRRHCCSPSLSNKVAS